VVERLRLRVAGDDGNRHLADPIQIKHVELAGLKRVSLTKVVVRDAQMPGKHRFGFLDARDDLRFKRRYTDSSVRS
jgi:hypothetical protein